MNEPRPRAPGRESDGSGRGAAILIGIVVVFVALIVAGSLGGIYVDWLWFQSVGLTEVFTTRLFAEAALFILAAVGFFVVYWVNLMVATRFAARRDVFGSLVLPGQTRRTPPLVRIAFLAAGIILALIVGLSTGSSWTTALRFLNQTAFGVADPLFHQDVSFFVFTLPMYGLIQGWFLATIILTGIAVLVFYFVETILPQLSLAQEAMEGRRSYQVDLTLGPGVKAHLSILAALIMLGFAVSYWLSTFELVFSSGQLFSGAGFADVHAQLPGLWLTAGAAVVFALLLLINIRRRGWGLALGGLALWLGVWILIGGIYPALVQSFQVQPNELDKEYPYIGYNIDSTNRAYGLDHIDEVDFPASQAVTRQEVSANSGTINNIRLLDPSPLLDTYNQIQSIRLYYNFLDIDVDRYMIDGQYRQVMLSARELAPGKLPSTAQTWINQHLQYTHGYGAVMSPVNKVTTDGLPQLFLQDVPPQGKIPITRPEIYYGEGTNDYVIVKTHTSEFDYPKGNDNVYVQYKGNSGVNVGSLSRRLLFAWQFGDVNLLATSEIKSDSSILFHRNVAERVQHIAPFLIYDRDPYMVIADGHLYWIIDAYTATDRYPYSEPVSLGTKTVNYMRNSVKVVVDAYDGKVAFYVADASDPLIATYSKIFPGMFKPLAQMPSSLRAHVRYPEDLFSVQAELFRNYHMHDPRVFYNKEDSWSLPNEIRGNQTVPMPPYYVIMRLPGQQHEEFTLILPFTPPSKDNMITWLAARSDGADYGKLIAYRYPKEKLIYGPMQIEARIDQEPSISQQLTLWNQSGSRVIRGNLIVIPIGQSNLYVEPIYLQSEQTKLPEMKRVVLATGDQVVMEPTVDDALAKLFPSPTTQPPATQPPTAATPPAQSKANLSAEAKALLDRMSKLQQELQSLQNDLQQLLQQAGAGTQ